MSDRWIRFSAYCELIKNYFQVSTYRAEQMAKDRAELREIKGVLFAKITNERYKLYRRNKR
jgi:hypothetical protein